MKFPSFSRLAVAVGILLGAAPILSAQDTTPPIVNKPIEDIIVPIGSGVKSVSLKKVFKLTGVTGPTVRFSTNAGDLDVELFAQQAPKTVAAFLRGTTATDATSYTNSLIQRLVPNYVLQGGGFYLDASQQINAITGRSAIPSEAGIKNTRGTLALALSNGPDSGVGDFFFNLIDNPNLDTSGAPFNGPFTVFGRVVGSLTALDKIGALPTVNLKDQLGDNFTDVPLVNFSSGDVMVNNLVVVSKIAPVPLVARKAGSPSILGLKVKNSNRSVVTAKINGRNLVLTPVEGATGTAKIRVFGRNKASGVKAVATFTYTVQ